MQEGIVLSRADRHAVRNAFNRLDQRNTMVAEKLIAGLAAADPACRVVVMAGRAAAPSMRAELEAGARDGSFVMHRARPGDFAGQLFEAIKGCRKPVIAHIDAVARGAGAPIICAVEGGRGRPWQNWYALCPDDMLILGRARGRWRSPPSSTDSIRPGSVQERPRVA